MGPTALLPIRGKVCCGFLLPLKIHRLCRFEPATFGSSGKHTNHYTTKATSYVLLDTLLSRRCTSMGRVVCQLGNIIRIPAISLLAKWRTEARACGTGVGHLTPWHYQSRVNKAAGSQVTWGNYIVWRHTVCTPVRRWEKTQLKFHFKQPWSQRTDSVKRSRGANCKDILIISFPAPSYVQRSLLGCLPTAKSLRQASTNKYVKS
jgi:hypothetical protein